MREASAPSFAIWDAAVVYVGSGCRLLGWPVLMSGVLPRGAEQKG